MQRFIRDLKENGAALFVFFAAFIMIPVMLYKLLYSYLLADTFYFVGVFTFFLGFFLYVSYPFYLDWVRGREIKKFCLARKIQYKEKDAPKFLENMLFRKITKEGVNISTELKYVMEKDFDKGKILCANTTLDRDHYHNGIRHTVSSPISCCIMLLDDIKPEYSSYRNFDSLNSAVHPCFTDANFRHAAKKVSDLKIKCEIQDNVFIIISKPYLRSITRCEIMTFMYELGMAFLKQNNNQRISNSNNSENKENY